MENQSYRSDDAINLKSNIKVIIKWKRLILTIFLVAVVAAVLSLWAPESYESTATVQLGSVNGLLIKNEEAKAIMLNQSSLLSIIDQLKLKVGVESLRNTIKISDLAGTNLIKVKVVYQDLDKVIEINNAIINRFIEQGQVLYQRRLEITRERLKELETEIKDIEANISSVQAFFAGIPSSSNISQSDFFVKMILLQNNLYNLNSLSLFRERRDALQLILEDAKDFKIFNASIESQAVGPNKKQKMLMIIIFGLMLGVFLAFGIEFWQKVK